MRTAPRLLLACLLACFAGRAFCADRTGTGAAAFLELPVDARGTGMGGAVTALDGGPMAIFHNPAALAGAARPAAAFSHALLVQGMTYDAAGAAVPLRNGGLLGFNMLGNGVLGVGAQYLRYGSFGALDNTGAPAGTLSPVDSAFSAGYAFSPSAALSLGAALKYIDSRIQDSASASAMDVGLLARFGALSAGAAVQNMGGALKFNLQDSPLAVNTRLGAAYAPRGPWRWALDLDFPQDGAPWLAAGAEYAFSRTSGWGLTARAGYSTEALHTGGLNGAAAGFSLERGGLCFDYAFKPDGELGAAHTFGLRCRFGGP